MKIQDGSTVRLALSTRNVFGSPDLLIDLSPELLEMLTEVIADKLVDKLCAPSEPVQLAWDFETNPPSIVEEEITFEFEEDETCDCEFCTCDDDEYIMVEEVEYELEDEEDITAEDLEFLESLGNIHVTEKVEIRDANDINAKLRLTIQYITDLRSGKLDSEGELEAISGLAKIMMESDPSLSALDAIDKALNTYLD